MATAQATAPEYRIGQTRIGQLAIAGEDLTEVRVATSHSARIVANAIVVSIKSVTTWASPIFVTTSAEFYPGITDLDEVNPGYGKFRRDLRKVTIEV